MKMSMRRKLFVLLASIFAIHFLFVFAKSDTAVAMKPFTQSGNSPIVETSVSNIQPSENVYEMLNLGGLGLSKEAFDYAVKGHDYLAANGRLQNESIISIVDFSLPSAKKRLFVIDIKNVKLLFNTYVSHGRGSGREMAKEFSNDAESFKSSLGFFITGDTYMGKHGFSMRLLGEEKGINDNANNRAIVMHSAAYVSEEAIKMQGFIGRSLGCPALPEALNKPIIEKIKNGSCLFLYSPDKSYVSHSTIIAKLA